jgi:hypothetical protein
MRAESRSPLFLIPLEYRERLDMSPYNALICLLIMPRSYFHARRVELAGILPL